MPGRHLLRNVRRSLPKVQLAVNQRQFATTKKGRGTGLLRAPTGDRRQQGIMGEMKITLRRTVLRSLGGVPTETEDRLSCTAGGGPPASERKSTGPSSKFLRPTVRTCLAICYRRREPFGTSVRDAPYPPLSRLRDSSPLQGSYQGTRLRPTNRKKALHPTVPRWAYSGTLLRPHYVC